MNGAHPLQAALSTLIPGGAAASDTTRLSTLADIVQNELRLALGLEEPKLVRLLKALSALSQTLKPLPATLTC